MSAARSASAWMHAATTLALLTAARRRLDRRLALISGAGAIVVTLLGRIAA